MRIALSLALALFVLSALPASAKVAPPKVTSIAELAALPTPLPYPYDEQANGDADVAAAFARAKTNGKRVFIDLGGNWCGDCRVLAAVMELPDVKPFVEAHYEVVAVDVGRYTKNMQIPAKYGFTKLAGVPTVLIVDAKGKLVNATNSADLADARSMNPQGIADWLARWAMPPAH